MDLILIFTIFACMKKKFRNITIDGDDSWAWRIHPADSYYQIQSITIWKDKKVKYKNGFGYMCDGQEKSYNFTPGLISRFIKMYLK